MSDKFKIRYNVYSSLAKTVDDAIDRLDLAKPFFVRFFDDDVSRRCKQALLALIMSNFINHYLEKGKIEEIRARSYSLINGKFNFQFFEKLKIIGKFTVGNVLVLKSLLLSFYFGKKNVANNAILHGYGREPLYEGSNRDAAIEFLENGPFDFINESRLFLGTNRPIQSDSFKYVHSKYPLLDLLKSTRFSVFEALNLIRLTFTAYFCFLRYSLENPIFFLLYSDFLWLPTIYVLNRKGVLEHYIFDNSDVVKQILPVVSLKGRNFTTEMIFYACNTRGFKYKQVDEVAEHPYFQFVKIDKAWVWNEDSKNWFRKISPYVKNISVSGEVLFYVDNKKTMDLGVGYKILAFDVTPVSEEWRKSFEGGTTIGFDFYSPENMRKFVEEVEASVHGLGKEVKVFMKPKRIPSEKWHDKKYVEMLKSSQRIQVLDPDTNIYELLRGVDLALAIPFTSPLYVADKLEVRSIYYDPTGVLEFNSEKTKNIDFIQSKEVLRQKVAAYYAEKMSSSK